MNKEQIITKESLNYADCLPCGYICENDTYYIAYRYKRRRKWSYGKGCLIHMRSQKDELMKIKSYLRDLPQIYKNREEWRNKMTKQTN